MWANKLLYTRSRLTVNADFGSAAITENSPIILPENDASRTPALVVIT
jgi:hypothetical protein